MLLGRFFVRFSISAFSQGHEGQAGLRLKRSCVDNIYTLNELVQGRMKEGKRMFTFFFLWSGVFNVEQEVAQRFSLSPISVFINGLLVAVEQAGLGIELSDGGRVGGLLFADDFVGVSESGEQL